MSTINATPLYCVICKYRMCLLWKKESENQQHTVSTFTTHHFSLPCLKGPSNLVMSKNLNYSPLDVTGVFLFHLSNTCKSACQIHQATTDQSVTLALLAGRSSKVKIKCLMTVTEIISSTPTRQWGRNQECPLPTSACVRRARSHGDGKWQCLH